MFVSRKLRLSAACTEIGLRPAAEFVGDDQGLNVLNERFIRMMLAQPRPNDPRAAKGMLAFVIRIAQRLDYRLIRTRKRALHVVRQGREPDRLRRIRRHAIEPFQGLQEMKPVPRVAVDNPGSGGVDQWRFHHRARKLEHIASRSCAIAVANGASLM